MKNLSSRNSTRSKSTPTPCCDKVGIKKGPWTPEEDEILADYIKKEGEGGWRTLPKRAGLLRCGKSCRLRWMNYLRPCVKRGRIAPDEEDLILRLHRLLGNRWSLIAGRIPGRTDNEIKNYWNVHVSKKLISQGIDPRTHKPLYPNPNSSDIGNNIATVQNSDPNAFPLEENGMVYGAAASSRVRENRTILSNQLVDQFPNQFVNDGDKNWPNSDGFSKPGLQSGRHDQNKEEDYVGNGNYEDSTTFSLFLESLINENVFAYQQEQQLQQCPNINTGSSAAASGQPMNCSSSRLDFHHGSIWDAEEVATSVGVFGETDNIGAVNI